MKTKKLNRKVEICYERYKKHLRRVIPESEKLIMRTFQRDRIIRENPMEFLNNLEINSYVPYENIRIVLNNKFYRRIFKNNPLAKTILAKVISENHRLLRHTEIVYGLMNAVCYSNHYKRNIFQFRFGLGNPFVEFKIFLRYLFDQYYEIPEFLFKYWCSDFSLRGYAIKHLIRAIKLFLHIGDGKSPRSFEYITTNFLYADAIMRIQRLYLNKKSVKYLYAVPQEFEFTQAIRWSQFMSICNNDKISRALLRTILKYIYDEDFTYPFEKYNRNFRTGILKFIINSPEIPIRYYRIVAKYINFLVFGFIDYTENIVMIPPKPNFDIRGRNPEKLLKEALEFEQRFKTIRNKKYKVVKTKNTVKYLDDKSKFPDVGICDFKSVQQNICGQVVYNIKRITTLKELKREGRIMRNCVGKYGPDIAFGNCSVWSLMQNNGKTDKKLLTIEIDVEKKKILKALGYRNREPYEYELNIIEEWAEKENLEFWG